METYHAIGRRKTSVARVYMKPGAGNITINGRTFEDYFPTEVLRIIVQQPLKVADKDGAFDFNINLQGGGVKGQAEAVRLGISRALLEVDAELRAVLKPEGFLTRDSRMVERKKYGRRKARRRFQFSKR
ncbi:30S ribosomal protein S9 [Hugenholtzia roseola]|uniref:30S ribosomal protein S9 n=1 Tax=Hugenholtzia roseola TaxID=1002 RepID=UPI00047C7993|nr:30S ribosomal protein S9 [Hugenholtzia roseola]